MNAFVFEIVVDRDANGDSQLNRKFSIANNGFFNGFGGTCAAGVEIADDERGDWNLSNFDFSTINCLAFLRNWSSSCK